MAATLGSISVPIRVLGTINGQEVELGTATIEVPVQVMRKSPEVRDVLIAALSLAPDEETRDTAAASMAEDDGVHDAHSPTGGDAQHYAGGPSWCPDCQALSQHLESLTAGRLVAGNTEHGHHVRDLGDGLEPHCPACGLTATFQPAFPLDADA